MLPTRLHHALLTTAAVLATLAAGLVLVGPPASASDPTLRPSSPAQGLLVVVRPRATLTSTATVDRLWVTTTVRNPQARTQPRSRVIVYLLGDNGVSRQVAAKPFAPIRSGRARTVTLAAQVRPVVRPGSYRVRVCSIRKIWNSCTLTPQRVTIPDRTTNPPTPPPPPTPTPAALDTDVATLDLGTVAVGQTSARRRVTVTNTGGSTSGTPTVTLEDVVREEQPGRRAAADFAVAATTCTTPLVGGATCTVDLTFSPQETSPSSARLRVAATPGGDATTTLTGSGTPVPAPASLSTDVELLDLGDVVVGESAPGRVVITNTGGSTSGTPVVTLENVLVRGTARRGVEDFAVTGTTCTAPLPAATSCTVDLRVTPDSTGGTFARLRVSADPGGDAFTTLRANGTEAPFVSLVATPDPHAFPDTLVGQTSDDQVITITNEGTAPSGRNFTIFFGAGSADFGGLLECDTGGDGLAPDESCSFPLQFIPSSAGPKSTAFTFADGEGHQVVVDVSGTGVTPARLVGDAAALDFPDTIVDGSSISQRWTVTNTGTLPTQPLTLASPGQTDQYAVTDGCTGQVLAGGSSCTVDVAFMPSARGATSATLTVADGASTTSVVLSGKGIQAVLQASPERFGLFIGPSGTPITQTVTVTNVGDAATGFLISSSDPADGRFVITNGCTFSGLQPGQSCQVSVTFTPAPAPNTRLVDGYLTIFGTDTADLLFLPLTGVDLSTAARTRD